MTVLFVYLVRGDKSVPVLICVVGQVVPARSFH